MKRFVLYKLVFCMVSILLVTMASAHADCTSPSALDGALGWNAGTSNYRFCVTSTWVSFTKTAIAGNPVCSSAAQIDYDSSGGYYKLCDGSNWYKIDVPGAILCSASATTYTTPGTYTYTVPVFCDTVVIEAYGGGGGGTSNRGGGGGGGGSVIQRNSDSSFLAVGGGGGGAGGRDSAGTHNGGGGGYASKTVTVTSSETLNVWVGGGGAKATNDNGAAGGSVSGGAGGGASGGTSTYGGGGGGERDAANGGTSTYGGGGGLGSRGTTKGGNSTYGGGGGAGDDGASGRWGTSTSGLNGNNYSGGGGGGLGDTVTNGTTGGVAANSGPGNGGVGDNPGGDGKVVITPSASGAPFSCSGTTASLLDYINNQFVYCNGAAWNVLAR